MHIFWKLYRKEDILEFIPSLAWCALCSIPVLLLAKGFQENIVSIQLFGVLIFQIVIWASDQIPIHNEVINNAPLEKKYNFNNFSTWPLISICIGIWIFHIYKMPHIPLVEKYLHGITDILKLAELREESSKFLNLPFGMIYIFQSTLTFLAPLTFTFLVLQKRWIYASVFFLLTLIYSRITLAKEPLFLFLAITSMLLLFTWLKYQKWYNSVKKYFLLGILVIGIYTIQFLVFNPKSIFNFTPPATLISEMEQKFTNPTLSPQKLTRVDFYRIFRSEKNFSDNLNTIEKNINFFTYRVLLVPVEVSYYWYFYFTKNEPKLGFYGLLPSTRNNQNFDHPANRVGKWALLSRFPDQYDKTLRAYCSVDADAYARFGYVGLFIIATLLFAFRIGLKFIKTNGSMADGLYYTTLLIAGLNLPASSIFSLAISSGISFYILLQLIIYIYTVRHRVGS